MPLPDSVVAQLGREAPQTPGWSVGIISFSVGILFIVVFLWAGLLFGYKPYLDGQASQVETQIANVEQSISPSDQTNLINFYSQLSNIQSLLAKHLPVYNIFPWLEANTEANVFYSSFTLTPGGALDLTVEAKTEADADQQIAIFENSPGVKTLSVSGISFGSNNLWQFTATITLNSSVFTATSTPL